MKPDISRRPVATWSAPSPAARRSPSEQADQRSSRRLHRALGYLVRGPGLAAPRRRSSPSTRVHPDQVKGARCSRPTFDGGPRSRGRRAAHPVTTPGASTPAEPEQGADAFVKPDLTGTPSRLRRRQLVGRRQGERLLGLGLVGDVSWADTACETQSPGPTSPGDSVSWADVSWPTCPWADVSWADSPTRTPARATRPADASVYELTPEQAAEIMADPETAPRRGPPGAVAARSLRRRLGDRIQRTFRGAGATRPSLFGGYSGRTEKGGCDPTRSGVASSGGEP
jgi:hypothetical protein